MTLGTSLQRSIKNQIIDKIDALSSVEKVYSFEKLNLEGFPAVIVIAGSMEGVFWSTEENQRTYSFRIVILYQIGSNVENINDDRMQNAEEAIGETVEQIMNAIDTDYELGQFNTDVLFVEAMNVFYGFAQYEGGYAKSAELTARVVTDYQVSS